MDTGPKKSQFVRPKAKMPHQEARSVRTDHSHGLSASAKMLRATASAKSMSPYSWSNGTLRYVTTPLECYVVCVHPVAQLAKHHFLHFIYGKTGALHLCVAFFTANLFKIQ